MAKTKKLAQILAIEKTIKTTTNKDASVLFKAGQKPELFNGMSKVYQPKDENGEALAPQNQRVQLSAPTVLRETAEATTELIDVIAAKDFSNCHAIADVIVDGVTLVQNAPPPFLLFLEKSLNDYIDSLEKLPVLDPAEDWSLDPNSGLYRTGVIRVHRTKKIQRPIVKYDATPQHPAQTEMITEDVIDGFWETTKFSGALAAPRKQELLTRARKARQAVKQAVEEANTVEATMPSVGAGLFEFLLK